MGQNGIVWNQRYSRYNRTCIHGISGRTPPLSATCSDKKTHALPTARRLISDSVGTRTAVRVWAVLTPSTVRNKSPPSPLLSVYRKSKKRLRREVGERVSS
jgi:hypothetical protein